MILKGQNFRVKIGTQYVAAATSCQLHIAANLEDASTKDDTANWANQEATGRSWDGSADALVIIDNAETALTAFDATELVGEKVSIEFNQTTGTLNRESVADGITYTGTAIVNDLSLTAGNRQNATYTIQFTGVGALTKSISNEE